MIPVTSSSTIAAIASAVGPSARIIIRISGPQSLFLIHRLAPQSQLAAGCGAYRLTLQLDDMAFPALVLVFPNGASYTGEASAELHLPGNVLLARMVLARLYGLGAAPAQPGEFTARAFFNGRLDLTEAEGVAATISARNQLELDAARQLQSGTLTRILRPIVDQLTKTLALVEAGIDFSEEDIRFISSADFAARVRSTLQDLRQLLAQSARFERLSHEPRIVFAGRPNSGKSTLLNALAGRARAIVSPIAGTTRDLLSAQVTLKRGAVSIIDTAGLDADDPTTPPDIARQMQEKAHHAIASADVLVLLTEAGDSRPPVSLPRPPHLTITSKCDAGSATSVLPVSAITGHGLGLLRQRLDDLAFGRPTDSTLALNARHLYQIELACQELLLLLELIEGQTDELSAEHLRYALDALGEITGLVSPDDILGKVFSTFCIGK